MPNDSAKPRPRDALAIAKRVEQYRRMRNKTQAEVAEHLGVTRMTYSSSVNGRRSFKASELMLLAAYFKTDVASLVSDTVTMRADESPLLVASDLCQWVSRLDAGDVSEGQFAKFLGLDRVSARIVAESCRAMAAVIARQVASEQGLAQVATA